MDNHDIKNLLIDFGSVLVNLDHDRCAANFRRLGLEDMGPLLDTERPDSLLPRYEKGLVSSAEFRDAIRQQIGKKVTDRQIDTAWNSFLTDLPKQRLDLLMRLRKRYVVYLLSNTNEIHWQWACDHLFTYRTFTEEDYFEKSYLSFQMGMMKPDTDIFKAVMLDAGITAGETFFIDDSPLNCQAAQSLGMATYTPMPGEDWSHLFYDD
ncbi:MAG: HAD family phosphatase [Mediterranea sp.]|jgi:putative hydrolase of the HAD superfamily|nr:HAD family phosphatase [Mediterranea sp.]